MSPPDADPAALEVEESRTVGALEALAAEWRALWEADPDARVFQGPDWLLAWRRHIGPAVALRTLAVRRGGRLVGLAPLFVHVTDGGERQLTWLGNGISDSLGPLAAPGCAAAVARAVGEHLGAAADWDVADLRDMPERAAFVSAGVPGAASELEADEARPELDLSPHAHPAERYDPKLRRDLAQCRRRAEAMGEVRIRAADAGTLDADLDTLFRLHAQRWTGRGEPGVLEAAPVQAFHREVSAGALSRGWLRLYVLSVGGEVAGVHYGFTAQRRAYFYLGGFDGRFERISPGALLLDHALAEAAREGAGEADFLRGREAYKYRWGAKDRGQVRRRLRVVQSG